MLDMSEIQMNMQVGEFPGYCWRCAYGEVKVPLTIPLDSDSETEKENSICEFQLLLPISDFWH